jgi:acetylornithine deacetylase/succinyl-diaminopimelate desuccinylase-like protein
MGARPDLLEGPSSTEANVFNRFGVECVVVGPGQGVGNSQAPNESIKLSELHQATEFYRRMLEELCL